MIKKMKSVLREPSKLRLVPDIIHQQIYALKWSFNRRKNYNRFLKSGQKPIIGDIPYDFEVVQQQLSDAGYPPEDYFIDINAFNEYCLRNDGSYKNYRKQYKDLFIEKALEHFISLTFKSLSPKSKIIDIANAGSPVPEIIHRDYGCNIWSNDLIFKKGIYRKDWHIQIGGDACQLPIEDNFYDLAVLHCALEMFEGNSDIKLVQEAERILKPGGKLVVIPLYVHERYHILRDPITYRSPLPDIDEGAELVYRQDLYGVAFARFYSVDVFLKRLVNNAAQLDLKIYRVRNLSKINNKCYLNWIAVFEKQLNDR